MLSLDEPLDLKLPQGRDRAWRTAPSICAPLNAARTRQPRTTHDGAPTGTPSRLVSSHTGVSPHPPDRPESLTPPAVDLSLSPSSRHAPSPSELSDGSGTSSVPSRDSGQIRYMEGGVSPQPLQFYLPIGGGGGFHLPSSMFIGPPKDKQAATEISMDEQLACRWMKCHLLFHSLQDLVDHVNDFHVKPEKNSGYCCLWEGCARNGRGFNARYKMLIHIRTHTNEKPHRCPTCSKSFSRLENLKIHTRSHTGEKPYICPYEGCSKRYSNSSDRFKHTRTHYVDKPYCCKMAGCLKRYTDPSSLRKHIKAHGHAVAPDHAPHDGLGGAWLKAGGVANLGAELPYVSGARIVIPGAAAALLGGHALQGLGGLPLSILGPRPLDLSAGGPFLSFNGVPLGVAKSPLLSPAFAASAAGRGRRGHGWDGRGKAGEREGSEDGDGDGEGMEGLQGAVLNLSAGGGHGPLSWVVIPPAPVAMKPAVVN
ncbi:zinc finger protein GLIS2-like [Anguilla rostrata]|uniref:zinc finger protein GLIS2-like n=1 Tax=Anguilla rostrata TaxID=7938 RepID=UPI0030D4171A